MRRSLTMFLMGALCALVVGGCAPRVQEHFVKASDRGEAGEYVFNIDFSDEAEDDFFADEPSYDLTLYTRADGKASRFAGMGDIAVGAIWTSPSGVEYREYFYIPADSFVHATAFSREYRNLYRSGVVPGEKGVWKLALVVPDGPSCGLRGMGLTVSRNK